MVSAIHTFNSNSGGGGSSLGCYDLKTDTINIDLEEIFARKFMAFYGLIPEKPVRFQHPIQFHELLAFVVVKTISHEWIHRTLNRIEGKECSLMYDNIPFFWEGS